MPQGFYKPSEDAQLHCNFTFPISDTLIFSTRYANFKEYVWSNGKWREGREFIEEEGLDFFGTFHLLHQMKFANDTFYLLQSIQSRIHVNVRARQAAMRVPVDVLALVLTGYMYLTVTGV